MIIALVTLGAVALGVALEYLRGLNMRCIHDSECVCYGAGYAAGKEKAHHELRRHIRENHAAGCGCQPCVTLRGIVTPLLMREAASALEAHPENDRDVCT